MGFVLLMFNPCCLTGIFDLLPYHSIKTPPSTCRLILGVYTAATSAGKGDRSPLQSSYLGEKRKINQKELHQTGDNFIKTYKLAEYETHQTSYILFVKSKQATQMIISITTANQLLYLIVFSRSFDSI